MENFKLGDRVIVLGKNISGKISFIGKTHFSEGEWFGIVLDEAKGRNNGCIDGQYYFKCPRNFGLFVRKCQLQRQKIEESGRNWNSNKSMYPNYLRNSSSVKVKKYEDKKENFEVTKPSTDQVHPMGAVIEDLENILKKEVYEITEIKNQKTGIEKKLKITEADLQKISEDFEKLVKNQKDLKNELAHSRENVLILQRKLSKSERKLEASEKKRGKLEMKIERLREITETAVIEKEISEEKNEFIELIAKDQTDKCKTLEIEVEILKEEMQLQYINGIPAIHYIKQLKNKIAVLNNALLKMRDLYQNLQKSVGEYETKAEECTKKIECHKRAEKSLEETICIYKEEVREFYEVIDGMLDADEIVFEVTERNLKSEAKINQLFEALQNAEDQLQVSEEVEEALHEIKSICKEEIECLESQLKHTELALKQNVLAVKNRDEIVDKYRELTVNLRERNNKLSEDFEMVCKDKKEAVIIAESLKLKVHRERRKNMNELVEMENMKFDLESYKNELSYWSGFLPENFFDSDGENSAIQVKLLTEKMVKKLELLIRLLQSSFPKPLFDLRWEELTSFFIVTKFMFSAYELQGFLKLISLSFNYANTENVLTFGRLSKIIVQTDEELNECLNVLSKDEIDRHIWLEKFQNRHRLFSELFEAKYVPKSEETIMNLESNLKMIQLACKCILGFFVILNNSQNVPSSYLMYPKKMIETIESLKSNVDFILKTTQNCEKENLCLLPVVETKIKENWNIIRESMENIVSIYQKFDEDNHPFSTCHFNDTNIAMFEDISSKMIQIDADVDELKKSLSNGDFFIEHITNNKKLLPIHTLAKHKKQESEKFITMLKNKVTALEIEIVNLSGTVEKQKIKISNKNKAVLLKDSSIQTEYNGVDEKIPPHAGDCSALADYLRIKLKDMECSLRYLSQKNFQLMIAPIKVHQKFLEPLQVLPKPKYHPDTHSICLLQKRLNESAVQLRRSLLPIVVDITRETACNKRKYKLFLLERLMICNKVREELVNIEIEVKRLRTSRRSIWSATNIQQSILLP